MVNKHLHIGVELKSGLKRRGEKTHYHFDYFDKVEWFHPVERAKIQHERRRKQK